MGGQGCCCFMTLRSFAFRPHRGCATEICWAPFRVYQFNKSRVSWKFRQRVVQTSQKYGYFIFLEGLCWFPVCWVLHSTLCSIHSSMSWVGSCFYFVKFYTINSSHHLLSYFLNTNNYVTFTSLLKGHNWCLFN